MEKETVKVKKINTNAEESLTIIANITLGVGIIGSIISLIYNLDNGTLFMGFILSGAILLSAIGAWAFYNVIANISLRLKSIQDTMPLKLVEAVNTGEDIRTEQEAIQNTDPQPDSLIKKGDFIIYLADNKEYEVESVGKGGRICIYKGLLAGYIWLNQELYRKV